MPTVGASGSSGAVSSSSSSVPVFKRRLAATRFDDRGFHGLLDLFFLDFSRRLGGLGRSGWRGDGAACTWPRGSNVNAHFRALDGRLERS